MKKKVSSYFSRKNCLIIFTHFFEFSICFDLRYYSGWQKNQQKNDINEEGCLNFFYIHFFKKEIKTHFQIYYSRSIF